VAVNIGNLNMSNKMRVQAKKKDDVTIVKVLINHVMETGSRKNSSTGEFYPEHFIEEVSCEHNNEIVMHAYWSAGISKNPYLAFSFKGGNTDDILKISWRDNKNTTGEATTKIKQG
jgi:sulfur-oxidizing protein SoxZ